MKAIINTVEKERIVDTGEEQLAVQFDIVDDEGTVLATPRIGTALDTDADTVKLMVRAYVDTFEKDQEAAVRNADREVVNAQADEVIAALTGVEI